MPLLPATAGASFSDTPANPTRFNKEPALGIFDRAMEGRID